MRDYIPRRGVGENARPTIQTSGDAFAALSDAINRFHGLDSGGVTINPQAPGQKLMRAIPGALGGGSSRGFKNMFSRDNTEEHGYGKLACSTSQLVAAVGAFTTPNFTLQKAVSDAVLYLSDDNNQVQDITSVTFGGETYTLSGALAASAFRDSASLGGPNKGLYLGDVDTSQVVSISGNTKVVDARFSFYVVGKFKGKGCSCAYGNQP